MLNISENFCEAVDQIVTARLQEIKADKTIDCTINKIEKIETGYNYTVFDGSISFTVYSDQSYMKGDEVLVLIPQGDYSNQKIITGLKRKQLKDSLSAKEINSNYKYIPYQDYKILNQMLMTGGFTESQYGKYQNYVNTDTKEIKSSLLDRVLEAVQLNINQNIKEQNDKVAVLRWFIDTEAFNAYAYNDSNDEFSVSNTLVTEDLLVDNTIDKSIDKVGEYTLSSNISSVLGGSYKQIVPYTYSDSSTLALSGIAIPKTIKLKIDPRNISFSLVAMLMFLEKRGNQLIWTDDYITSEVITFTQDLQVLPELNNNNNSSFGPIYIAMNESNNPLTLKAKMETDQQNNFPTTFGLLYKFVDKTYSNGDQVIINLEDLNNSTTTSKLIINDGIKSISGQTGITIQMDAVALILIDASDSSNPTAFFQF